MRIDREDRYNALQLAQSCAEPAEKIVERASLYLGFLKGESDDGNAQGGAVGEDPDFAEARRAMKEWMIPTEDDSAVQVVAWAIKRGRETSFQKRATNFPEGGHE